MRKLLTMTALACCSLVVAAGSLSAVSGNAGEYVVVVGEGLDPAAEAARLGVQPTRLYESLGGFVATFDASQAALLALDPRIRSAAPNRTIPMRMPTAQSHVAASGDPKVKLRGQVIPDGIRRIGGLASPTARINGRDERVGVDVAVIEGGVDPDHDDLNVAGTVNCIGKRYKVDWHATMAAGIIGALDNRKGVVGVAPGARIWGVNIFGNQETTVDALLCAIDWVIKHAKTLEVVNMSVAFDGTDDPDCGIALPDPFHLAICEAIDAGVVFAASAGNGAQDTETALPAAYDEVIAVSAMADYDGQPGGLAAQDCFTQFDDGADDTFATYSNFGADVDISAPGNCIFSTASRRDLDEDVDAGLVEGVARDEAGLYAVSTGTSFSCPHVAGAAALYMAAHRDATPDEVKAALLANAEPGPIPGDPDGIPEGIVNVSGF